MEMQRFTFAVLLCAVLSVTAASQPVWAADSLSNRHGVSALAAKTKLSANQLGKTERLAALRANKLAKLNDGAVKHKSTLMQQALAFASTARGNETSGLSDRVSSLRSQFTSKSVKDAIGTLGQAAGIRDASEAW
jgi:hypothetical protein